MVASLELLDGGAPVAFTFADMLRYHGPGSPGGVAHAFKVLERALPVLGPDGPLERRAVHIRTAFGGPGARDGFELVTRAVTEHRYVVDASLVRPHRGPAAERFVFCLTAAETRATLVLRDGFVTDDFVRLAGKEDRSSEEERVLAELKLAMADCVMGAAAADVYDVVDDS